MLAFLYRGGSDSVVVKSVGFQPDDPSSNPGLGHTFFAVTPLGKEFTLISSVHPAVMGSQLWVMKDLVRMRVACGAVMAAFSVRT